MIRTEATIVRAAPVDLCLEAAGHIARFQILLAALVIFDIGGHQRLLHAMLLAAFLVIHLALLKQDLGRRKFKAILAQRLRLTIKDIGAGFIAQYLQP